MKPLVAIVGRPNVGKSTLFNRLVGRREAVVTDIPGTTRDRVSLDTVLGHRPVVLVDTGGLGAGVDIPLAKEMAAQAELAIREADVIIFLTDVLDGVTPSDEEVAGRLRRAGKPVVLAVNKVDNQKRVPEVAEFYRLGLGGPLPVSAYHGEGIEQLARAVVASLPEAVPEANGSRHALAIAIIGRVNVGKSALLNAILGQDRAIVSDMPGTTRDALDTPFVYRDRQILLVDTAGIRRPGRILQGIEQYSVLRSLRAIDRSDVVLLILDASELATAQDAHLAGRAAGAFKGVVLVVNKWDLARELDLDQAQCLQVIHQRFQFLPFAPVRFVSALHKVAIPEVLDAILAIYDERQKQVPRQQLTDAVLAALAQHPPPARGRRSLRMTRVVQNAVNPPTFTFYVNDPSLIHFSYHRYLENRLRDSCGFRWNRLKLVFKGSGEA